jgi:hypothetical protein
MRRFAKIGFFCWCVISMPFFIYAQDTTTVFDRPGAADSPYLVPHQGVIIETGFSFVPESDFKNVFIPGALIRYSPTQLSELRMGINYLPPSFSVYRYNEMNNLTGYSFGFKRKLMKEERHLPELALMTNIVFYTNHGEEQLQFKPHFENFLLFHNNVFDFLGINYNLGVLVPFETDKNTLLHYSVCLNFNTHDKVSFFAEHFFYHEIGARPEFNFDAGVMYLPCKNLQLDLSYAGGFWQTNYEQMVSFGMALFMKKK